MSAIWPDNKKMRFIIFLEHCVQVSSGGQSNCIIVANRIRAVRLSIDTQVPEDWVSEINHLEKCIEGKLNKDFLIHTY